MYNVLKYFFLPLKNSGNLTRSRVYLENNYKKKYTD